jgi:hypothetical protein
MRQSPSIALALAALLSATVPLPAQDQPMTLRAALQQAGFTIPAELTTSDLDCRWNSSSWDHDHNRLVAAIHFEDEMQREFALGAMHIIEVTRAGTVSRRRLVENDPAIDGDSPLKLGGSVVRLSVHPQFSIIATHVNPSAHVLLVAENGLKRITALWGFGPEVLADSTIVYRGSMVHFAPFHANTLHAFSPGTRTTVEVFPGQFQSRFEEQSLTAVKDLLSRLSEAERQELDAFQLSAGVDRDFIGKRVSTDGRRIALAVYYGSHRLSYGPPISISDPPRITFHTVALCSRVQNHWNCREEALESAARRHGIPIPEEYPQRDRGMGRLLELVLAEP